MKEKDLKKSQFITEIPSQYTRPNGMKMHNESVKSTGGFILYVHVPDMRDEKTVELYRNPEKDYPLSRGEESEGDYLEVSTLEKEVKISMENTTKSLVESICDYNKKWDTLMPSEIPADMINILKKRAFYELKGRMPCDHYGDIDIKVIPPIIAIPDLLLNSDIIEINTDKERINELLTSYNIAKEELKYPLGPDDLNPLINKKYKLIKYLTQNIEFDLLEREKCCLTEDGSIEVTWKPLIE